MRRLFKILLFSLSSSVALTGACSSGGGNTGGVAGVGGTSSGSDCQKLCDRAASIQCGDDQCLTKCETPLSACDSQFRGYVKCAADSTMLGCVNGNMVSDECTTEEQAFTSCLTSGTGGTGGSGGTGGISGTTCEKVCTKAKNAGCEPENCVTQCETDLPKCDAEFDAFNACAADKGTLSCSSTGKPEVAGCETEEGALGTCILGGGDGGTSCYTGKGSCDPMNIASCPAGQACDFSTSGSFQCFPAGSGQVGSPCAPGDCAAGLACVNTGSSTVCAKYCCEATDCSSGQCLDTGDGVKLCGL